MSIVVVGNGPSAKGSGQGAVIDQFDEVVRMNNFETDGYEADVGTKTTIWARHVYDPSGHIVERDIGPFKQVLLCCHYCEWAGRKIDPYEHPLASDPKTVVVERETVDGIFDDIRADTDHWPSNGLITLAHFLRRYQTVHMIGFDAFVTWAPGRFHYFEEDDAAIARVVKGMKPHKTEAERNWLAKRVNEGRLVPLSAAQWQT